MAETKTPPAAQKAAPAAKPAAKKSSASSPPKTKASTPKAAKPTTKTAAAKKAPAAKKSPAAKKTDADRWNPGNAERYHMVQVAAFYLAERDSFSGNPMEYWAAAEMQISSMLPRK